MKAFTCALGEYNLNLKKMLQVSMDGPNVNLKFLRDLQAFLANSSDPDDPVLFDIGTCSLHVVNGAYKTAHNACGWKVHIFLRALYYLFKDFPSRRSDYIVATKSSIFPLRFCAIRWVENSRVIQRALDMLPFLKMYVAEVAKKPPASTSYEKVKKAVDDKLLAAKLGFLQSVAIQLEPYLTRYQSNNPLLPFMYQDLYTLLRSLMLRFVKADIMSAVTSVSDLLAVDFAKKDNHKVLHDIDIGFAASAACKSPQLKGHGVDILKFKEDCCKYLQHACKKLIEKCPLKYRLVKGASCLSPEVMLSDSLRESRVSTALEVFVDKKRMLPSSADIVKREYLKMCDNPNVKCLLRGFNRDKDRLDDLLHSVIGVDGCDSVVLTTFMHQIMTLFHGNAAVERSFSINKECLIENLHEDSLIAQRVVYDAVSTAGGITGMDISKAMIHSARNASAKRIEAAKKKTDEQAEATNRRKRIADEIKALEEKKRRVADAAKSEEQSLTDELKKLRNCLK